MIAPIWPRLILPDLVAGSPDMADMLLAAESESWRPVDWSAVPAWSTWRAEVGARRPRRRFAEHADPLLWAAYCEAEAARHAQAGLPLDAAWWLEAADDLITALAPERKTA
jgi:hypothetical protein